MKPFLIAMFVASMSAASAVDSLFEALRQGDEAKVKTAVERGFDVNHRDDRGNSLLMQAAVYSTRSMLEFLLAHGADARAANDSGYTALMRALPEIGKVNLLIEHGADVNASTSQGDTALIMASTVPGGGELVRYLIAKHANLDVINNRGAGAVIMAASVGQYANLKILIEAGAGTFKRRITALRPLSPDAPANARERVAKTQRALDGATPLLTAATAGCRPCVELLLEKGDDAGARTRGGMTALHFAAYHGDLTMVTRLLAAGAPVDAADERGFTPLMMAVNSRNKDPETPRLLLAKGADPGARDQAGRTVTDWARVGARPEVIKLVATGSVDREVKPISKVELPAGDEIRAAVQNSITLLNKTAPNFFRNTGCISCHNVSIPMMALAEARSRGYKTDPVSSQQMVKEHIATLAPFRENLLSGYCTVPGFSSTVGYAAIAMHAAGHQADFLTDSFVHCLLVQQHDDGHWESDGVPTRPPLHPHSGIPGTALAARTLRLYAIPAFMRQAESAITRARAYLASAKSEVGDDYAFRLMGLSWAGAASAEIAAAGRDLIAQQRPDGGWAQTPELESDAYATGLALTALSMADPAAVNGAPYRRGVDYLLHTREADGSWHVRTRAFGFQPYFESGFPHGEDQWISMAATAWSAQALMSAMALPKVMPR